MLAQQTYSMETRMRGFLSREIVASNKRSTGCTHASTLQPSAEHKQSQSLDTHSNKSSSPPDETTLAGMSHDQERYAGKDPHTHTPGSKENIDCYSDGGNTSSGGPQLLAETIEQPPETEVGATTANPLSEVVDNINGDTKRAIGGSAYESEALASMRERTSVADVKKDNDECATGSKTPVPKPSGTQTTLTGLFASRVPEPQQPEVEAVVSQGPMRTLHPTLSLPSSPRLSSADDFLLESEENLAVEVPESKLTGDWLIDWWSQFHKRIRPILIH